MILEVRVDGGDTGVHVHEGVDGAVGGDDLGNLGSGTARVRDLVRRACSVGRFTPVAQGQRGLISVWDCGGCTSEGDCGGPLAATSAYDILRWGLGWMEVWRFGFVRIEIWR